MKSMTVKAPAFPISCALFHVWDPDNITPLPDLSTNQCEFVELCFSGPIPELVAFETVINTGALVPWLAEGSCAIAVSVWAALESVVVSSEIE